MFEINDAEILAKINLEIGLNLTHLLQFIAALEHYKRALELYEKNNWKLGIAETLLKMANLYAILGDFDDAKKLCFESLSLYKARLTSNDTRIAEVFHTLGFVYFKSKNYEESMDYL